MDLPQIFAIHLHTVKFVSNENEVRVHEHEVRVKLLGACILQMIVDTIQEGPLKVNISGAPEEPVPKEFGKKMVYKGTGNKRRIVELEQLATPDGYQFTLSEETYINLQGALAAYIADTPASHEAAGFKEGVGLSFKKCRHCHATFEEVQSNFLEENFHARSLQEHLHYLDSIKECEDSLLQHLSMVYGVNRASILLDFPYFDVCEQMPQDVMHVLFEGVIPYTVKLVLHHFIRIEKQLTIQQLNRKLIGFNYAYFNKKYQPNPFSQQDFYIDGDYIQLITTIYSRSWAEVDNIKYVSKECVLFTGSDDNGNPVFSKLDSIVVVNDPDHIFFQCQPMDTVGFDDEMGAYKLQVPKMASGLEMYT
ncbi:predicted protein [Nematostella vectensis]|uniref:Uncharacterized protein n=1 Tax=Nematostella vectensis TaxID=45351 RepID=A7SMB7_NEMVE|nr:predicted protein [Nematostella vectensis]|eukprot:XP_001627239.1 predicted protein [Nematostella vectensis]